MFSPILVYPHPAEPFILDTSASDTGIGAVLSQVQDGHQRVMAYTNKTLHTSQGRYCTMKHELLVVVTFMK